MKSTLCSACGTSISHYTNVVFTFLEHSIKFNKILHSFLYKFCTKLFLRKCTVRLCTNGFANNLLRSARVSLIRSDVLIMTNSNKELYIVPFTHDVIVLEQNCPKKELYRWRTNRGFFFRQGVFLFIFCIRKLCPLPR